MTQQPQRIAILRLAALGDIIMTIPLIRTLQHSLPTAELYWIISRPMLALVQGLSGVNFIVVDKPHSLKSYCACRRILKPYQFDTLLVPQASLRSNLLCPLINAKTKIGFGQLHSRDWQHLFVNQQVTAKKEHLIDSFLRFVEPLGIQEKIIDWQLPISTQDWQWAKTQLQVYPGKWLALCPISSKPERNWPVERFIETINQLNQQWQFNLLLVGGPGTLEKELAQTIQNQVNVNCLNLVGKSNLKQLAALLGSVDALLAPDTGPAHMATAMQTPVVGLYAVAPPEKTGPYFSEQWVVNKFPQAVRTLLHKDPAQISWRQRVHSNKAMQLITVDDVVERCNELFKVLNFSKK